MNLLRAIIAHCIGDYLLQQCNIIKDKRNNMNLLMHCILYIAGVYLVFGYEINTIGYYILLISHFMIDYIKANGYTNDYSTRHVMIIDQALHFAILLLCIL